MSIRIDTAFKTFTKGAKIFYKKTGLPFNPSTFDSWNEPQLLVYADGTDVAWDAFITAFHAPTKPVRKPISDHPQGVQKASKIMKYTPKHNPKSPHKFSPMLPPKAPPRNSSSEPVAHKSKEPSHTAVSLDAKHAVPDKSLQAESESETIADKIRANDRDGIFFALMEEACTKAWEKHALSGNKGNEAKLEFLINFTNLIGMEIDDEFWREFEALEEN